MEKINHIISNQMESRQENSQVVKNLKTSLSLCRSVFTDEKICEILDKAYKEKVSQVKTMDYFDRIDQEKINVPRLTPEEYQVVFEQNFYTENERQFEYNPGNSVIIDALCLYFAQDKRFEDLKENFSLKKGILLIGGVGVGKTTIMKAFRANPIKSYGVVKCQAVVDAYLEAEKGRFEFFTSPNRNISRIQSYGQEFYGWLYDDLGLENQANRFGNKLNVMGEVVDKIYNHPDLFGRCHVTTNLDPDQIEGMYGERIRSRMKALFNTIQFPGSAKDMRV